MTDLNQPGTKIGRVTRFIQKNGIIRSKFTKNYKSKNSQEYIKFGRVKINKRDDKFELGDVISDHGHVKIYRTEKDIPVIVLCEATCGLWCYPGFVICTPGGCCFVPKGSIRILRSKR